LSDDASKLDIIDPPYHCYCYVEEDVEVKKHKNINPTFSDTKWWDRNL